MPLIAGTSLQPQPETFRRLEVFFPFGDGDGDGGGNGEDNSGC